MGLVLKYNIVRLPLIVPFKTSFGNQENREAIIFTLEDGNVKAFSECVTDVDPFYSYEDNFTAMHMIRNYLAREISDLPMPKEFLERTKKFKGHNMAKAAMEMLLWDYHSKANGIPLHKYLGKSKGYADVGISIGMMPNEQLHPMVLNAMNKGYQRIKLKIARGYEEEIVSFVRNSFPEATLSVDANCDYTISDIEMLRNLDKYNLAYIEQPLAHDSIVDHAALRQAISTKICLDESITSPDIAREAFQIDAADIINIKPGRVAGLQNSLEIAEIVNNFGGHCWVGGMLETGVGRSFNIAIASNTLIDMPGDTSPNDKYFVKDIVRNTFKMESGRISPFESPGIGVIIDDEFFEKSTVESGQIALGK